MEMLMEAFWLYSKFHFSAQHELQQKIERVRVGSPAKQRAHL